jgi:hypothetical protein
MTDQSQSSRFRVLFESALQDYQKQTGTTLTNHPVAEELQNCDSVESVTAMFQQQVRALGESRGGDGRIMKSLKCIVYVLYTLSAVTLNVTIGLVRRDILPYTIWYSTSLTVSFSYSHLKRPYLLDSPSFSLYEPLLFPSVHLRDINFSVGRGR